MIKIIKMGQTAQSFDKNCFRNVEKRRKRLNQIHSLNKNDDNNLKRQYG